jgi:hypothetical protein
MPIESAGPIDTVVVSHGAGNSPNHSKEPAGSGRVCQMGKRILSPSLGGPWGRHSLNGVERRALPAKSTDLLDQTRRKIIP